MAFGELSQHVVYFLLLSLIISAETSNSYRLLEKVQRHFFPEVFTVQGIVYCKSGSDVFPLKGSIVRISCVGLDKFGDETAQISLLTRPTDGNGYFLTKLSSTEPALVKNGGGGFRISQCKAFLHSSPLKAYKVPSQVNNGAMISAYRLVGSRGMRLYSIGPFIYTP